MDKTRPHADKASIKKSMKYRINIIEYNGMFFTGVAAWQLNSASIVHAYIGPICV